MGVEAGTIVSLAIAKNSPFGDQAAACPTLIGRAAGFASLVKVVPDLW